MTAGGSILAETKNGKWQQYLYDGSDQLMAIRYKGADYYYIRDGLMCITGLVDANGGAVVNYRYDSWGKLISITGSMAGTLGKDNPYRYKGYYYDDETGMYYISVRYYNPEIARFINTDTEDILDISSHLYDKNLYAYCDNNPIMRKDTGGEFWTIAASVYIRGKGIRAQGEPYRKSIDNLKRVRGNVSKALSNPKGYRHQINRAVKRHRITTRRTIKSTTKSFAAASFFSNILGRVKSFFGR